LPPPPSLRWELLPELLLPDDDDEPEEVDGAGAGAEGGGV
jgi:hypothetical protein